MSLSAALRTICLTLLAIVSAYLHTAQAADGKRVALVVGNSAYQHVERLVNPASDAAGVGTALRSWARKGRARGHRHPGGFRSEGRLHGT
jgi:hypothetical protein